MFAAEVWKIIRETSGSTRSTPPLPRCFDSPEAPAAGRSTRFLSADPDRPPVRVLVREEVVGAGPARPSGGRRRDETERVFRNFDSNGVARSRGPGITMFFECVGHVATDDEVFRFMEEADADGDGYINLLEFAALIESASTGGTAVEEELRHAFKVFDTNGNGLISPAELVRVHAQWMLNVQAQPYCVR